MAWTGAGDGTRWSQPLNWSSFAVPGATDDVSINVSGLQLADAAFYAKEPDKAAAAQTRHAQIDAELTRLLERWEELGSRAAPTPAASS